MSPDIADSLKMHQPDDRHRDRFIALYQAHHRSILRYAWRRVAPAEAEDVTHETFAVTWRRLDQVPADGELPWLYQVARNVIRNRTRTMQRDSSAVAGLRVVPEPDFADAITDRQLALAALASLGDADRELVQLIAWEGLRPSEACLVLGCSPAAVYLRLHRLRRRLERLLIPPVPEEGTP